MRYAELRRHTGNDGDRLTAQEVADAEAIGRDRLRPPYAAFGSTGAARATQMLEILRHAAGQDETPITSGGRVAVAGRGPLAGGRFDPAPGRHGWYLAQEGRQP
jgi:hypothetical protein